MRSNCVEPGIRTHDPWIARQPTLAVDHRGTLLIIIVSHKYT